MFVPLCSERWTPEELDVHVGWKDKFSASLGLSTLTYTVRLGNCSVLHIPEYFSLTKNFYLEKALKTYWIWAILELKHMLTVRTESRSKLRRTFSYLTHPDWDDRIWTLWLSLIQKRINVCEKVMATWGHALKFWNKALNKCKRSCNRRVSCLTYRINNQARPRGFSQLPLCLWTNHVISLGSSFPPNLCQSCLVGL